MFIQKVKWCSNNTTYLQHKPWSWAIGCSTSMRVSSTRFILPKNVASSRQAMRWLFVTGWVGQPSSRLLPSSLVCIFSVRVTVQQILYVSFMPIDRLENDSTLLSNAAYTLSLLSCSPFIAVMTSFFLEDIQRIFELSILCRKQTQYCLVSTLLLYKCQL